MAALLLVVLAVAAWFFLKRANELCAVSVVDGAATLRRGKIPPRFLADVEEIVRRAAVPRATLRVVVEGGTPRLVAAGELSATVTQQLRNALGQHRVVHFRTGRGA